MATYLSLRSIISNHSAEQKQPMKLLVRNLARSTTETELRELFEAFGTVQSCTLVIDKATGGSKGFGFVEIPKAGEAKVAMKSLNGTEVAGNRIRVKKAEPKSDKTAKPDSSGDSE
jgi:RNA recognition motif-containing protein